MKQIILLSMFFLKILTGTGQIIADHTVVNAYDKIPQIYIDEVKKMLVDIAGESHSAGYRIGMELLESLNPNYQVLSYDGSVPASSIQNYTNWKRKALLRVPGKIMGKEKLNIMK